MCRAVARGRGRAESWPVAEARVELGDTAVDDTLIDQDISGARAMRELGWRPTRPSGAGGHRGVPRALSESPPTPARRWSASSRRRVSSGEGDAIVKAARTRRGVEAKQTLRPKPQIRSAGSTSWGRVPATLKTAVDQEPLPGDVGGIVTREEERGGRHLFRRSPARKQRDATIHFKRVLARKQHLRPAHRCVDGARQDGVHADARAAVLDRHLTGEPQDAGLGRGVGGKGPEASQGLDR